MARRPRAGHTGGTRFRARRARGPRREPAWGQHGGPQVDGWETFRRSPSHPPDSGAHHRPHRADPPPVKGKGGAPARTHLRTPAPGAWGDRPDLPPAGSRGATLLAHLHAAVLNRAFSPRPQVWPALRYPATAQPGQTRKAAERAGNGRRERRDRIGALPLQPLDTREASRASPAPRSIGPERRTKQEAAGERPAFCLGLSAGSRPLCRRSAGGETRARLSESPPAVPRRVGETLPIPP